MKKILLTLLTIFMLVPLVGTLDINEVKALGQSEMACSAFEVDYINDDGSFTSKGCYDDLSSAKSAMKSLGGDHVVRHAKSLSYTKIVAMNSGIAYSYPRWGATLSIYQDLYNRTIYYKSTYIARHYEMDYIDTSIAAVGRSGYTYGMIEVYMNGFHGYCDLENVDLVPSKYINNEITIVLGGNNSYTSEDFFSIKCKQNYYYKNSNGDLVFQMYYGYPLDGSTTPEGYSYVISKASDAMNTNTPYYSYNGYEFYTNKTFTDNKITYYNYYQFLPLRSKSTVTADMLNSYISSRGYNSTSVSALYNSGSYFIEAQEKYGVNALILFSMAIHESGFGRSDYALYRNNLFGWSAYDADPGSASYFYSVYNCVQEQAGINLRGFLDIYDGRFFSSSLGNKGSGLNVKYASDPYWGMKIASYCYAIDKNYNNSKDLNAYSLSLVNTFDIPLKASASDGANTLYTTQYGPYYQENFIVITLGDAGNGYTKVQSTNPIDSNGNVKTHRSNPVGTGDLNDISSGEYNYDTSVAYIKSSYLTVLNSGNSGTSDVPDTPSVDPVVINKETLFYLSSLAIDNGNLKLSGVAYISGMDFDDLDDIKHVVYLKNTSDGSIEETYYATTSEYTGAVADTKYNYKYVQFDVTIPLDDISSGSDFTSGDYYLAMDIVNGDTSMSTTIYSFNDSYSNITNSYNGYNYRIKTNPDYSNRFEISIESMPEEIKYNEISKPSTRNSLFSFNTFTIDEDGNFYMKGNAMIYYCDTNENVKYTLYLIDDANNYKAIECNTLKTEDYIVRAFNSSYDYSYIGYETKDANISDLNNGYYIMILKIENGSNIDYVEMTNVAGYKVPSTDNYRFFTSSIRSRLTLQVKKSTSNEADAD